jgi:dephospho-CoA kinase
VPNDELSQLVLVRSNSVRSKAVSLLGVHGITFSQTEAMLSARRTTLCEWRPEWAADFALLASQLSGRLGERALRIDHIGSTAVPGLRAKDVIDVQVVVARLDHEAIVGPLEGAGFVDRREKWNLRDHLAAGWIGDPAQWSKFVLAPPEGSRASNVHVRVGGAPNERYALLFRDFLTADAAVRTAWGHFKDQLANTSADLLAYGAVKDPATDVLLALAEQWASRVGWSMPRS